MVYSPLLLLLGFVYVYAMYVDLNEAGVWCFLEEGKAGFLFEFWLFVRRFLFGFCYNVCYCWKSGVFFSWSWHHSNNSCFTRTNFVVPKDTLILASWNTKPSSTSEFLRMCLCCFSSTPKFYECRCRPVSFEINVYFSFLVHADSIKQIGIHLKITSVVFRRDCFLFVCVAFRLRQPADVKQFSLFRHLRRCYVFPLNWWQPRLAFIYKLYSDPDQMDFFEKDFGLESRFAFTSARGGEYRLCFGTNTSTWFGTGQALVWENEQFQTFNILCLVVVVICIHLGINLMFVVCM